jgi:hypothetical protein
MLRPRVADNEPQSLKRCVVEGNLFTAMFGAWCAWICTFVVITLSPVIGK